MKKLKRGLSLIYFIFILIYSKRLNGGNRKSSIRVAASICISRMNARAWMSRGSREWSRWSTFSVSRSAKDLIIGYIDKQNVYQCQVMVTSWDVHKAWVMDSASCEQTE